MKIIHTCYFSVVRYVKGIFLPFSKSRLPIYHNFIPYSGFNGHHPTFSVYFFCSSSHIRARPHFTWSWISCNFPAKFCSNTTAVPGSFSFYDALSTSYPYHKGISLHDMRNYIMVDYRIDSSQDLYFLQLIKNHSKSTLVEEHYPKNL